MSLVVAGIDVGGNSKGFHAVALKDGAYFTRPEGRRHEAREVARWCRNIGAKIIAVDAPCRWSLTGRARPAERELMKAGISCFSTPTLEAARLRQDNYYSWMLNGAALFEELERTHPLFAGNPWRPGANVCFETFPHAIACALDGGILRAANKRNDRRRLLDAAGIQRDALTNIDLVDAALCAFMAHSFALKKFRQFGEPATGFLLVPATQ